jgi:hypothetical protein
MMEDAILSFPPRNGLAAAPRSPLAERLWQALGRLLRDCFPVWADTPPYGDVIAHEVFDSVRP